MKCVKLTVLYLIFLSNFLWAQDLKVSMAYLPRVLESTEEGTFAEMVSALDSAYSEGEIKKELFPFARSLHSVVAGDVDFHIPLIINPLLNPKDLPYRYATCKNWDIVFIICSNKENPISVEDIRNASNDKVFPYKILTDRAHVEFFEFPIHPVSHVEGALKQVSTGRADAFIFAQVECDYVIKRLPLKYQRTIHRAPFGYYKGTIVVQKGSHGDWVDSVLTVAFKTAESKGLLDLLDNIKRNNIYDDWQTSD